MRTDFSDDDRTDARRTQEPGERSDDLDEKDDEIATSRASYQDTACSPQELRAKPAIRHRQAKLCS